MRAASHIAFDRTRRAPGNFDADWTSDIAVFQPATGTWNVRKSSTGLARAYTWGGGGDIPILQRR